MIKRLTILTALLLSLIASAEVSLPAIISSKMVLQRNSQAPIWGWADKGEKITVAFGQQTKTTTANGETGEWMVKLDPMEASSEPRAMTVKGENTIVLNDVLVGEVWLASGQSNMEWSFSKIAKEEKKLAADQKDNPLLRAFHVPYHLTASRPLADTIGWWKNCEEMATEPQLSAGHPTSVSAVGFFFALTLQKELNIPVAFIDANWGGRNIELFIPSEGYEAMGMETPKEPDLDIPAIGQAYEAIAADAKKAADAVKNGRLVPLHINKAPALGNADNGIYNAMIAPLTPFAIKGVIWYQGESNRGANDYFNKLQALSAGWSKVFNVKDIPFYQVQIAPYAYNRGKQNALCDSIWAAQYKGAAEIPGMGIVAIHDTAIDIKNIHPIHKKPVGERLAAQALKNQYGKNIITQGPRVSHATRKKSAVIVSFDHVDQGLSTIDGKAPTWFELSEDGTTFIAAEAAIKGNTVEVSADGITAPSFVRMGWQETAIPTLQDKNGWPAFAFPAQKVE
ncbi:MAG: sialate O-acetylesterase [Kiritimatiellaceae bacterium]|nr:sialate O-acetylesterase [Kiritimatiellaceae bacterium]